MKRLLWLLLVPVLLGAAPQFKTGDLVRLKSGGPVMTVQWERTGCDGVVNASWFSYGTQYSSNFMADSLEPVPPPAERQ